MGSPDPAYRPNPDRCVHIQGEIDQEMVHRAARDILRLQSARDPITVYIDSPGGTTQDQILLLRLLKGRGQDGEAPCRILTVVTGFAGSAAADLLSEGDYAVGYPDAIVLHHGVRTLPNQPLTLEAASGLTVDLKSNNDVFAMALAKRCLTRLIFRFILAREEAQSLGKTAEDSELRYFQTYLYERLSASAREALSQAMRRTERYVDLAGRIGRDKIVARITENPERRLADLEGRILQLLLSHHLQVNRSTSWSFSNGGLSHLIRDFTLVIEYFADHSPEHFQAAFERWAPYILPRSEANRLNGASASGLAELIELHVRPVLLPVWILLVALCRCLQEGENYLTATDAYWLGLIDEVWGTDLPCLRRVAEYTAAEGDARQA